MTRLLEMLRHDNCDDSVTCDYSLAVGNHLNVDLPLTVSCSEEEPQSSPLRHCTQSTFQHDNDDQHVSSSVTDRTPSAINRKYDATSGQCRTSKLPDVQVRLTSPQHSGSGDLIGCSPASAVTVISRPDVINDPHYTVV